MESVLLTLIGMVMIAGMSVAAYALLPKAALRLASEHGRYYGLGIDERINVTPSTTRIAGAASSPNDSRSAELALPTI